MLKEAGESIPRSCPNIQYRGILSAFIQGLSRTAQRIEAFWSCLPCRGLTPAGLHPLRIPQARAFTIAELLMFVACLVVMAAILLPALARSKARSSRIGCAANLRQLGLAFRTWSLDNNDRFPMRVPVANGGTEELVARGAVYPHFQVMSNELSTPKILLCPWDAERSCATNFASDLSDRNLSYFLNVDATGGDGSSLLAGDRNITNRPAAGSRLVSLTKADSIAWTKEIHSHQGFIAFGAGGVQSFSNRGVSGAIRVGAGATNWLAVP